MVKLTLTLLTAWSQLRLLVPFHMIKLVLFYSVLVGFLFHCSFRIYNYETKWKKPSGLDILHIKSNITALSVRFFFLLLSVHFCCLFVYEIGSNSACWSSCPILPGGPGITHVYHHSYIEQQFLKNDLWIHFGLEFILFFQPISPVILSIHYSTLAIHS